MLVATFAFVRHILDLHWIAAAFLVNHPDSGFMLAMGAVGPALLITLITVTMTMLWSRLLPGRDAAPLGFTLAFSGSEWLQGNLFTGLPWNLIAHAWIDVPMVADSLALWGVHGSGLLLFLTAATGALLILLPLDIISGRTTMSGLAPTITTAGLLWSIALSWNAIRSAPPAPQGDGPRVRIVQNNIPQAIKWRHDMQEAALDHHTKLSTVNAGEARPDIVIWPETALPFNIGERPLFLARIGGAAPAHGFIAFGTWRVEAGGAGRRKRDYNSMLVVDGNGLTVAHYDKVRLVPFAEASPFPSWLGQETTAYLSQLTTPDATAGFWDAGAGPVTLRLPGIPPAAPLICHEIIYPDPPGDGGHPAPEWILNIANDGWHAGTDGPRQHLAISRVRAMQTGLPVVRSTNMGISALIDAHGQILAELPEGTSGHLDVILPEPAWDAIHPVIGQWLFALLWAGTALAAAMAQWQPRNGAPSLPA